MAVILDFSIKGNSKFLINICNELSGFFLNI